jgi:predicted GH43/DUF377 family glycosyl hydrolase
MLIDPGVKLKVQKGAFNPSICEHAGKTIVAYRLDARASHWHKPKIYISELVDGRAVNDKPIIEYGEDPRLFKHIGRIYIAYTVSPQPHSHPKINFMRYCRLTNDLDVEVTYDLEFGDHRAAQGCGG